MKIRSFTEDGEEYISISEFYDIDWKLKQSNNCNIHDVNNNIATTGSIRWLGGENQEDIVGIGEGNY